MADILNLQVKDETLSNIISNNPYYVDIKGSVNICLIRCGQEIENCNSVNFSTMTNYGKILVLNPDKTKLSKCNIKLAFDNNNDTINNDGNGKYTFEKAFFTVPSLHKLNGQVFDMETFLLFSSIQKNGTILYVCLCVFNTGTNIVQNDDPKLLNFKLLNELFSKGNSVPDIYGTNQINGIPNPVDLSNFIPEEGTRNFYDYTHPSNTKVNFRIFQTPMYVSNDIISLLKSKLTPGNIYQNFKNYITKSINPHEGLFFYFSEDLTNHYKSFQKNNIQKDSFKNIADSIIEEQEIFEKEEDFKKLDIKKDSIIVEEEEDKIDYNIVNKDEINKSETFSSKQKNESNNSITIIIFIISFMLIVNVLNVLLVNNLFTPSKNIVDSDLPNCLNEMVSINMKNVLGAKFRNYCALFWQGIITFLVIILLIFYMSNNNSEQKIYTSILIFLSLIFINSFVILIFNIKYFVYRLKSVYDDDFSQKENYLLDFILKKTYKNNTIMNIINILKGDFTSFLNIQTNPQTNPQSGGSLEHPNLVPGPDDEDESLKSFKYKTILDGKTFWELIFNPFEHDVYSIFKEKFNNNYMWKQNLCILFGMTILFFIIGILFQLKYISLGNNSLLLFIVSGIITVFLYLPFYYICLISIYKYYFVNKEIYKKMYWVIFGISCVGLFISLFIPFGNVGKKKNLLSNVPFWLNIGCIILCILVIVISNFIKSGSEKIDEIKKNEENEVFNRTDEISKIGTAPTIENEILNEYLKTKNKLNEIQEKQILYEEEEIKGNIHQPNTITGNNNKEYIKDIENEILLLIELLKEIVDKILFYEQELKNIGDSNKDYQELIEEKIKSLDKRKKEIEEIIKIYMNKINRYSNHTKENSEKVQKLSEELNKIKEHMSNRDESLLLLKNISNEQKEKEMLYKDYFNYSIDELEKTIENILEFVKLYKLNSVISSLYFTLKLINKLKEIEGKRSDIEYNEKIIEILDKLKGIDFSKSINEDIKKLDTIKDNKTRIQIEKTLNSVEEQIRTIIKNIKI